MVIWEIDGLTFGFSAPSSHLDDNEPFGRNSELLVKFTRTLGVLPYRLDVWAPQKVMSLEWSADDKLHRVISFRSGTSEDKITDLH